MATILGVLTPLNERNLLEQGYFNAKLSLLQFNVYVLTAIHCDTLLKYSAWWNHRALLLSAQFVSRILIGRGWEEILRRNTSHYSEENANIVTFNLLFYEPSPMFPLRGKWNPLNKAKSVYRVGPLWPRLGLPLVTSNPCLRFLEFNMAVTWAEILTYPNKTPVVQADFHPKLLTPCVTVVLKLMN